MSKTFILKNIKNNIAGKKIKNTLIDGWMYHILGLEDSVFKMSNHPNFIHKVNGISIRIPAFFFRHWQGDSKMYIENEKKKKPKKAKAIIEEQSWGDLHYQTSKLILKLQQLRY